MTDLIEQLNAWCRQSGVGHCDTCDDTGLVRAYRQPTIDDPYPEAPCDDCSAEDTACKVCGNSVYVSGFDCLVCDTVLNLSGDQLDTDTAEELGKAITAAIKWIAFQNEAQKRDIDKHGPRWSIGLDHPVELCRGVNGDDYMLVNGICTDADAKVMAASKELIEACQAFERGQSDAPLLIRAAIVKAGQP